MKVTKELKIEALEYCIDKLVSEKINGLCYYLKQFIKDRMLPAECWVLGTEYFGLKRPSNSNHTFTTYWWPVHDYESRIEYCHKEIAKLKEDGSL